MTFDLHVQNVNLCHYFEPLEVGFSYLACILNINETFLNETKANDLDRDFYTKKPKIAVWDYVAAGVVA